MKITNAILAIDAAWTNTEPSAVALVKQVGSQWLCQSLAPDYGQFIALAEGYPVDWSKKPEGATPDLEKLLSASEKLLGNQLVNLITVDMPVSKVPINGYREAEREIARAFSKYGCAAHAPSTERPGRISEAYTRNLSNYGFELGVKMTQPGTVNRLLEVYPHPALMRLMEAGYRLEYKAGKTSRYWPELSIPERKRKLYYIYKNILERISKTIIGLPLDIPSQVMEQPFSSFKRFEDSIDALVCAWVGIQYLQGNAKAYGDQSGAIWVPE